MKNVQVEFNTRTCGVETSLKELRRRWAKSPGFQRLLKKAAYDQLRGEPVTLKASNKRAGRALELAVCKVRRTMELDTEGHQARQVYLMRKGKTWAEVHKAVAVKAQKETTPDTLAVMPLWIYDPSISWAAAAKLDRLTAPEMVAIAPETVEFSEHRERESAHPNIFEEDASRYNDAGELETPSERRDRLAREGVSLARAETFEDAWKPLPLKKERPERAPVSVRELPAAPYYYALESKMDRAAQEELSAERRESQERRTQLGNDEAERTLCAELGEGWNDDEDLEAGMLEPHEAWEHYAMVN